MTPQDDKPSEMAEHVEFYRNLDRTAKMEQMLEGTSRPCLHTAWSDPFPCGTASVETCLDCGTVRIAENTSA